MKNKILTYVAFIILFWLPFSSLIAWKVSESIALAAAVVGILPLFILFSPLFARVIERLSSVKVGNVELGFQEAISESLKGEESEQVSMSVDAGTEDVIYGKGSMTEFLNTVNEYLPNPKQKLVISVDISDEGRIDLPMLYFQARTLNSLFDLRALLFIDKSENSVNKKILGTITPAVAFHVIEQYIPDIETALGNAIEEIKGNHSEVRLRELIDDHWRAFTNVARNHNMENRLNRNVYQ